MWIIVDLTWKINKGSHPCIGQWDHCHGICFIHLEFSEVFLKIMYVALHSMYYNLPVLLLIYIYVVSNLYFKPCVSLSFMALDFLSCLERPLHTHTYKNILIFLWYLETFASVCEGGKIFHYPSRFFRLV